MVRHRQMFTISMIVLCIYLIFVFPFPHRYELGTVIFTALKIPIRLSNGFMPVGITAAIILIIGLVLFLKSLKKYHIRLFILVIVLLSFIPSILIDTYQNVFAENIYALSYDNEKSECNFDMVDEDTLFGECELLFENKSNQPIQFTIQFQEHRIFKEDVPIVSLMNQDAPYEIELDNQERKRIKLTSYIDVSTMDEHIENGRVTFINLKVQAKGKYREL